MPESPPIITVDGPGGTGKGTLCCYLADRLQWHLLDSGALYRVLALAAQKKHIKSEDEAALLKLVQNLDVEFKIANAGELVDVFFEDSLVTDEVRTEECAHAASVIAPILSLRRALLGRQRAFHQSPGLIADGRDMGTVVFPLATVKFFLTASPEERAKRRYKQLKGKGISVSLRNLSKAISARDERDSTRSASPLKPAEDAIIIDTGSLTIKAVIAKVSRLVADRITTLSAAQKRRLITFDELLA